jgi:hypothetical protein
VRGPSGEVTDLAHWQAINRKHGIELLPGEWQGIETEY